LQCISEAAEHQIQLPAKNWPGFEQQIQCQEKAASMNIKFILWTMSAIQINWMATVDDNARIVVVGSWW
jgi:hypothetical protein